MDALTRTKFQWLESNPPLSLLEKLIVLTPRLLHGLHMMILVKALTDSLEDRECKRITLRKHPLVPYVPEKEVQEMVSALSNNRSLKTTIGEGTELHLSIWHTRKSEAHLMHVGLTLDVIKKQ